MQIDDRLATVLRQRAGSEATARIQYRQLLDLLGSLPSETGGGELDAAYERLGELSAAIPAAARAAMLREPGLRLRNAKLAVLLCEQEQPVASATIGALRLSDEQWLDLAPALPVASRALLRERRDLGPKVERLLARLGIRDRGLPPAQVAGDSASPAGGAAAGEGIGAIVRRIEDFRKSRQTIEGEAAEEHAAAPVRAFDFATDARGRIGWCDAAVAPMVAGLSLASQDGSPGARMPRSAARAMQNRQPVRAAVIEIAGAPAIEGNWIADAAPKFDPATGGFIGYRGRMRRLKEAEQTEIEPRESEGDRIRQLLHELKTPVNAVQGFAEAIQQQLFGPAPHEYRALAATIAADAARILAGFSELERLIRIEGGTLEVEAGACDLAEVIAATQTQLHPYTASRDSGFAVEIAEFPLTAAIGEADARQLAWRLLATLAGAAHPGETMRLQAGREGDAILVRLQLPVNLAHLGEQELMNAVAGQPSQALTSGSFGTGFALRLARAEAKASGGGLSVVGQELHLRLPGLDPDGPAP